jgi:predicted nuclease of predicted toxin-antitoxin system
VKVLLDACTPRPLRSFLAGHAVSTAQEMGWGALKNGDLLQEAERQFEVFISTDQNLKYQQQVIGRKLAILVLPTTDWPTIRANGAQIAGKVATLKPGDFVELDWPDG